MFSKNWSVSLESGKEDIVKLTYLTSKKNEFINKKQSIRAAALIIQAEIIKSTKARKILIAQK